MRMKSFYAASIATAIDQARREFGPEAIIVQSRPTPPDHRHLGAFEVVVATEVDPPAGAASSSPPAPPAASPPPATLATDTRFNDMLAAMREDLEAMRRELLRQRILYARNGDSAELSDLFARLLSIEFSEEFAAELIQAVRHRLSASPPAVAGPGPSIGEVLTRWRAGDPFPRRGITSLARLLEGLATPSADSSNAPCVQDLLRAELGRAVRADASLGQHHTSPRLVALVGPPGVGKTTSIVKLAVNYGLLCRRPTHLISIDTQRVGAADQLRAFAAILGVTFQAADSIAALAQALEEHRQKELIFVDTPGFSPAERDEAQTLADFFAARKDVDVHLVLNASTKPADLMKAVERFEIFRPAKLLISKIDETSRYGAAVEAAARHSLAISYLAAGRRIPEDIAPATKERILDLLLGASVQQVRSAA